MSGQEHTGEPWTCTGQDDYAADDPRWRIDGGGLYALAVTCGANDKANARRIVACVNACAGIPTDALEAGVIGEVREALEAALEHVEISARGAQVEDRIIAILAKLGRQG